MQEIRLIPRTDQSSDPDTENAPSEAPVPRRLLRLCAALVMVICAGWLLIESMRSDQSPDLSPSAVTPVDSSQQPHSATKAIKDIRVGERVLAENPELHQAQRTAYREPDWSQWLQLSLVMLKEDGSELNIELLRSEDWVRSQLVPIHAPFADQTASHDSPQQVELVSEDASLNPGDVPDVPLSPLRSVFRELVFQQVMLEAVDRELIGMAVEMDLPELAITGPALLVDMQVAPSIKAGQGRVVTATFQHRNADVIDLTIGDAVERETIGTTSNHPFWSEDRQAFVQAGTLKPGERVRTYLGDTKKVISLRPRPGPQAVYNLEVHAEHVYYVGNFGTLVHNAAGYHGVDGTWSRIETPWGRSVLQRRDIDWNYRRTDGMTNLEAARRGNAPRRIGSNGKEEVLVLHHFNNDPGSRTLAEVWSSLHSKRHVAERLNGKRIKAGSPDAVPDPLLGWRNDFPKWGREFTREQSIYWRWYKGGYSPPVDAVTVPPSLLPTP